MAAIDAPHASTPAITATHGPSHGRENAGGKATDSSDAATTTPPAIASARSLFPLGSGRASETIDRIAPATAAAAATSDHRPARVHAPNAPDPGPNRLHGRLVATIAAPNAIAVIVLIGRRRRASPGSIAAGASVPSTVCRHSDP